MFFSIPSYSRYRLFSSVRLPLDHKLKFSKNDGSDKLKESAVLVVHDISIARHLREEKDKKELSTLRNLFFHQKHCKAFTIVDKINTALILSPDDSESNKDPQVAFFQAIGFFNLGFYNESCNAFSKAAELSSYYRPLAYQFISEIFFKVEKTNEEVEFSKRADKAFEAINFNEKKWDLFVGIFDEVKPVIGNELYIKIISKFEVVKSNKNSMRAESSIKNATELEKNHQYIEAEKLLSKIIYEIEPTNKKAYDQLAVLLGKNSVFGYKQDKIDALLKQYDRIFKK